MSKRPDNVTICIEQETRDAVRKIIEVRFPYRKVTFSSYIRQLIQKDCKVYSLLDESKRKGIEITEDNIKKFLIENAIGLDDDRLE